MSSVAPIVVPIVEKRVGRKPGAMTAEAKVAMLLKRAATIAAKQATVEPKADAAAAEPKERKKRAPLSDEAKKIMAAKRAATLAAKAAKADVLTEKHDAEAVEQAADKPARKQREPMTAEAKASMAAKRAATIAAKKAAEQPLPPSPAEDVSTPKLTFAEPLEAPPAPKKAEAPRADEDEQAEYAALQAVLAPEPPLCYKIEFAADPVPPRPKGPKPSKKAKVDESSADESSGEEGKKRKQRAPMTDEAKAAMAAKRAATIAAKKTAEA